VSWWYEAVNRESDSPTRSTSARRIDTLPHHRDSRTRPGSRSYAWHCSSYQRAYSAAVTSRSAHRAATGM
jgi:hypothetical protein